MLGLLAKVPRHVVRSNREAGLGRYNICIKPVGVDSAAVLIEFKIAKTWRELAAKCDEALAQISQQQYAHALIEEGFEVLNPGIAFCGKVCLVKVSSTK